MASAAAAPDYCSGEGWADRRPGGPATGVQLGIGDQEW